MKQSDLCFRIAKSIISHYKILVVLVVSQCAPEFFILASLYTYLIVIVIYSDGRKRLLRSIFVFLLLRGSFLDFPASH